MPGKHNVNNKSASEDRCQVDHEVRASASRKYVPIEGAQRGVDARDLLYIANVAVDALLSGTHPLAIEENRLVATGVCPEA